MIECPFCKTVHVDNTVFCSECGHYLIQDNKKETDPIDSEAAVWLGSVPDKPKTDRLRQRGTRSLMIRLRIGSGKREVEVPLDKIIHVGRVDATSNVFPEIDLTPDGSVAKTVSRRHATIIKQGDRVVVEDTGSINGTFVNGKRLDPYLPEPINDGDTLQFGQLLVDVEILR